MTNIPKTETMNRTKIRIEQDGSENLEDVLGGIEDDFNFRWQSHHVKCRLTIVESDPIRVAVEVAAETNLGQGLGVCCSAQSKPGHGWTWWDNRGSWPGPKIARGSHSAQCSGCGSQSAATESREKIVPVWAVEWTLDQLRVEAEKLARIEEAEHRKRLTDQIQNTHKEGNNSQNG